MIIVLSIPSFVDLSGLIPGLSSQKEEKIDASTENKDKGVTHFAILDKDNIIKDKDILNIFFPNSHWTLSKNLKEVENLIKEDKVKAGFYIKSPTEYSYLVKNNSMHDSNETHFSKLLSKVYQETAITNAGLNYNEINNIYNTQIKSEVSILGKDTSKNFFYTYILIFSLYILILIYGQLIAMSVTAEKSNRAVEVLITSTSSNSLIFGKVIAGALASIVQVGVILSSGIIGYKLNTRAWDGLLDNVFNIPTNLLITFALFGIVGYLLYSLIFGALGALVSKTEDIGSSVTPIMLIFVAVFLISIFGLSNGDSLLIKICSFIPFSSPMTMLVRVAMGNISNIEIIVSFLILVVTTILTGILAAKIYRMGTLMYGNPIKLRNLFKRLKTKSN